MPLNLQEVLVQWRDAAGDEARRMTLVELVREDALFRSDGGLLARLLDICSGGRPIHERIYSSAEKVKEKGER